MMSLLMIMVKTSLILTLGMLAAFALRRRSAALRHWILAAAIICAAAAPVLGSLVPSWTLPRPAVSAATRTSDVQISFRPIGAAVSRVVAAASEPRSQERSLLGRAANLIVPIWLIGMALNLGVLAIGMVRLTRLQSSGSGEQESATIAESLRQMSVVFALRRPVTLVRSDRQTVLFTWAYCGRRSCCHPTSTTGCASGLTWCLPTSSRTSPAATGSCRRSPKFAKLSIGVTRCSGSPAPGFGRKASMRAMTPSSASASPIMRTPASSSPSRAALEGIVRHGYPRRRWRPARPLLKGEFAPC